VARQIAQLAPENSPTPTDAKPTSTTPASQELLSAANPAAAKKAAAAATNRPRAVANSPSANE